MFFDILSSINNPDQEGSVEQLGNIINGVNQLSQEHDIDSSTLETVMSGLGGVLRPALKEQVSSGDSNMLGNLFNQFTGQEESGSILESFLTPELQGQMVEALGEKTGLNTSILQGMLPMLLPQILNLFKMGGNSSGNILDNPLLKTFLDSDKDGDVDLGDVFKFGNRFLNPPN